MFDAFKFPPLGARLDLPCHIGKGEYFYQLVTTGCNIVINVVALSVGMGSRLAIGCFCSLEDHSGLDRIGREGA